MGGLIGKKRCRTAALPRMVFSVTRANSPGKKERELTDGTLDAQSQPTGSADGLTCRFPWSQIIPFSEGDNLHCALSALGITISGTAKILQTSQTSINLHFDFPEQRALFKKVPASRFEISFDYQQEGGGNRTALKMLQGNTPASQKRVNVSTDTPPTIAHSDAVMQTSNSGTRRRVETLAADGRPIGFTIVKQSARRVQVIDFALNKLPPGVRLEISKR